MQSSPSLELSSTQATTSPSELPAESITGAPPWPSPMPETQTSSTNDLFKLIIHIASSMTIMQLLIILYFYRVSLNNISQNLDQKSINQSQIKNSMSSTQKYKAQSNSEEQYKKTAKKPSLVRREGRIRRALHQAIDESSTTQMIAINPPQSSMKKIVEKTKAIIKRFKFSSSSYLACLLMLDLLRGYSELDKVRLTACTIVIMAGKVYQHQIPKFAKFVKLGKGEFQKQDLVLAQAQILHQIGYCVPIITQDLSQEQTKGKIEKYEKELCSIEPTK